MTEQCDDAVVDVCQEVETRVNRLDGHFAEFGE